MKKLQVALCAAAGMLLFATGAMAAPTGAGTTISNQATAQYKVDAATHTVTSPETSFKVAQIINFSVVNMGAEVMVSASDTGKSTSFKVTNTGNGTDNIILSADSVVGQDFLPQFSAIYIDDNNGYYDPADTSYALGSPYRLDAGQSITVFVLNNIPAEVTAGKLGKTQLKAQSQDFKIGAVGAVFTRFGAEDVDIVLGIKDGAATAEATYKVTGVKVTLDKSSVISNSYGTTSPIPGATVTYSIVAQITGSGTATDLKIIDQIPANTTYVNNSLKLDGLPLTDNADLDAGSASPTVVTFTLGDVEAGTANRTVSFQVVIN